MTTSTKTNRFWLILALGLIAVLWLVKPILLPFVAGMVLAYFLDPAVVWLTRWKVPRWLGTLMVLLGFILAVVLVLLLLMPLVHSQLATLIDSLPGYVEALRERFMPRIHEWMRRLSPHDVEKLRDAAGTYAGSAAMWAGQLARKIITEGLALFDIVTLFVITPVIAFYMLRDWPKVTHSVDSVVPRGHHALVRHAMKEIDRTLSGFLRGQALVCISLGLIYGAGLTLVGLKYGATIGLVAGILSFIPYVGSTFVLVVSLALAFIQFDNSTSIFLTFCVYLVGQVLEGYVLTPKLVGDRVGLHPAWILFALFAGGSLLGFAGVLIAVPVAAVVGVLTRIGLSHYKKSTLYHDKA